MASKTSVTELKRKRKNNAQGKRRKAQLRTQGSTFSQKELFGESLKPVATK